MWQFGRLIANKFIQDPQNFTIDRLAWLYGALEYLLQIAADGMDAKIDALL